ncbi:MAG: hypothetical protein DRG33_07065 [Deltaproteobacteria bacterium]|nr:MAG: hypothetical protein DRG33_07065 [Deltaproteobacteria bacterium]
MGRKKAKKEVEYEDPRDDLLSLFLKDLNGNVVGESIGVSGEKLVVKSEERFYLIPLSSVEKGEGELKVVNEVDWEKALKEGERWREKELDLLWGERSEGAG